MSELSIYERHESVANIYNERAEKYDESHHPDFAARFVTHAEDPSLASGDCVVDLACGTGLATRLLAEKVAPSGHVYGIDISTGMLQVATRNKEQADFITYENGNITDLGSIECLRGKEGTVDLITCVAAFVLLQEPERVIKGWTKFLKPGKGRLLVDVNHSRNLMMFNVLESIGKELGIPFPVNHCWVTSEEALRTAFTNASPDLIVETIDFEGYTGKEVIYYDVDRESTEKLFDDKFQQHFFKDLREKYPDKIPEVKRMFLERWLKEAGPDGKVAEVDGGWIIRARRAK